MTTRPAIWLECDGGCGLGYLAMNLTEARERAAKDSWVTVPKVRANGLKAKAQRNDVCPECMPEFSARPARNGGQYHGMSPDERRIATALNIGHLVLSDEEKRRLKGELARIKEQREKAAS